MIYGPQISVPHVHEGGDWVVQSRVGTSDASSDRKHLDIDHRIIRLSRRLYSASTRVRRSRDRRRSQSTAAAAASIITAATTLPIGVDVYCMFFIRGDTTTRNCWMLSVKCNKEKKSLCTTLVFQMDFLLAHAPCSARTLISYFLMVNHFSLFLLVNFQ